ncbi:hypothetical protein AX16_009418 [Volvariella volvacea WC 439]|nr:hypothetical protein AX16_009418 [Volvariella volvacea WC 439]
MLLMSLFLAAFAQSLASPVPVAVPGNNIPSPVCVVAAAVTASRCDPTRTRTIFDILYSCIGVILLCTYISIHHNIPDQNDSWAKVTWLKLRTTLYALIAPEIVIMWAIRQWIMARRIARENQDRRWTVTHGFFIQMGGLVQCIKEGERTRYEVLCPPGPWALQEWKSTKIPFIPEKEIQDHGKGDLLAKAVVVIQTTWFVAQCIARHVQGLVLTEIELITLAFATLNVITYGLWWNKPLNIGYPIYFDKDGNRVDGPLATVGEPEDEEDDKGQVQEWEEAGYSRIWRNIQDRMAECGEACKNAWESVKSVLGSLWDMMTDVKTENRPTSVHPFFAGWMDVDDEDRGIICGSLIGVLFGGIHLIGWNFQFSTIVELWLWRVSSLVLTITPAFLAIGAGLEIIYNWEIPLNSATILGGPFYFAARMILLFLAFFTLRALPEPAYQNVKWTEFIPHI